MKISSKFATVQAQNGNPSIINADDFGLDQETNLAIVELLKDNRIQRTTLMTNMPLAAEAYKLAKDAGHADAVGLHLNLTDGKPISNSIKDTRFCQNGLFMVHEMESGTRLYVCKAEQKAIDEEIVAQFERFKEITGHYPYHMDGHRHVHNYLPILFSAISIGKKRGLKSMRIGINLFDRKEASLFKKVYKLFINTIIKFNFETTDYMGAFLEYMDYFHYSKEKTVEIMVHPTIHEGKIVDIIYDHNHKEYYDFDKIR